MPIRGCSFSTGVDYSGLSAWSASTTYTSGSRIYSGNSPNRKVYSSQQANNLNHAVSDTSWWALIADGIVGADGTCPLPYKNISDASSGLTGGDEVRISASPASTPISTSLVWTNASVTVIATGVDITAEVAAKDCIGKTAAGGPGSAETYWEISTVTYSGGNTTITLSRPYIGETETIASRKCGVTDTGTGSASVTVQMVSASGTSHTTPLIVSGGWNFATGERTGQTWLMQSGADRLGNGLLLNGLVFVTVQYIGFLRYGIGVYVISSRSCSISNCSANNGVNGLRIYLCSSCNISGCTTNGNTGTGSGLSLHSSHNCVVSGCVTSGNAANGLLSSSGSANNRLISLTANSNATGVSLASVIGHVANNLAVVNNGTADVSVAAGFYLETPVLSCQRLQGAPNANVAYYEHGTIARTDVSGGFNTIAPGVLITPSSAVYYIRQDYSGVGIAATGYILGMWLKKSANFNGNVFIEAYNSDGEIVAGPTAVTLTESFAQYTIEILSGSMPAMGTVRLRLRVRGTAGTVWACDFSVGTTTYLMDWNDGVPYMVPPAGSAGALVIEGMVQ